MKEWRRSPSFPDYEVSESGEIRRARAGIRGGQIGKVMKPYRRADGYNMFILRRDNRSFHKKAHQLVAEAFIGPKPFDLAEVCHNDGSRDNDHWTNLRWDTRAANQADRREHGTDHSGERHPAAKLSAVAVREIRHLISQGSRQSTMVARFGVRQNTISRIVNGERWAS